MATLAHNTEEFNNAVDNLGRAIVELARVIVAIAAVVLLCVDVLVRLAGATARRHVTRENLQALGYYALVVPLGAFLYLAYETVHLAVIY